MKALVTGATGFIGRHLVRALLARGCDVRALVFMGRSSAEADIGCPKVTAASGEVDAILAAVVDLHPDAVFHLAAAGVNPRERNAGALLDGNARLLGNVLAAFRDFPPKKFIYAGSSAEYSPAKAPEPISEDHPALPRTMYGAAKASATAWGLGLASQWAIPFVCLRLFHVYGPGEAPGRLLRTLSERLARREAVDLSPGGQARDMLHVDDVVSAFIAAAEERRLTGPVYNVCSSRPVTVRQVAEAAADAVGAPRELLRFGAVAYRADDEMWVVGNNELFCREAAWEPRIPLTVGLSRVLLQQRGAK